jgi:hypothetical protein
MNDARPVDRAYLDARLDALEERMGARLERGFRQIWLTTIPLVVLAVLLCR